MSGEAASAGAGTSPGDGRAFVARFLRYLLTGGPAAVVDLGGFALLLETGLPLALAGAVSFCAAAAVNYALTSRFVFRRRAHARGFAVFIAAAGLGLSINVGVTWAAATHLPITPVLAKALGIGVAFVANFLLNNFLVFSARVHGGAQATRPRAL